MSIKLGSVKDLTPGCRVKFIVEEVEEYSYIFHCENFSKHRHIAHAMHLKRNQVLGGGLVEISEDGKELSLDDLSVEFGSVPNHILTPLIDELKHLTGVEKVEIDMD